jgi:hypothetical protein
MALREGLRRVGLSLGALYWVGAISLIGITVSGTPDPRETFNIFHDGYTYRVAAYSEAQATRLAEAYWTAHPPGPRAPWKAYDFGDPIDVDSAPLRYSLSTIFSSARPGLVFAACLFLPLAITGWLFGWIIRGFAGDPAE